MRILFVYKKYEHDPTLHATLRWLPRMFPSVQFFAFTSTERRQVKSIEPNPRLMAAVEAARPTHVWAWNNLINRSELESLIEKKIRTIGQLNSFLSFHSGHIPSQREYFDFMKRLDLLLIPNGPDVPTLISHGINAVEIPFYYDPDIYRELSKGVTFFHKRPIDLLFLGSLCEPPAANRYEVVKRMSSGVRIHTITYKNPRLRNVVWHRPISNERLINWWHNLAQFTLSIEHNGSFYSPAHLNSIVQDRIVDYQSEVAFRGNRIFPAMGAGCIIVTDQSIHTDRFLSHRENALVWKSPEEAIDLVQEFKKDRVGRKKIARNAMDMVFRNHSAEVRLARVKSLISSLA